MGFFDLTDERINTNQPPVELLHKQGCALCTLDREAKNLANPKMAATGSKTPLIYILGEAPGADEDKQGEQFVGVSGSYLRDRIPLKFNDHIRFNNALNCRPPGNRDPTSLEIECCRPRILEDIETTQPEAIFAMGGFALHWAGIPNGITAWRGRRLPVRIGRHVCWLFPMVHPAYLLHLRSQNRNSQPSNFEMAFDFDIRRAFREVAAGLPEPVVHTEQIAKRNIECFTGKFHNELGKIADFLEEAATRERAGVDYETQNLRPYHRDSAILTTAVALPERAIAFAVDHPEAGWSDRDKRHLTELWTRFLRSPVAKTAHHCFSGNTQIITKDGLRSFNSVVGQEVSVWQGSDWVESKVSCFGEQGIWELDLVPYNRSRSFIKHTVETTANHRWVIDRKHRRWDRTRNLAGPHTWEREQVTTEQLLVGDRIIASAPNTREPDTYSEAFIHGLIFADGALCSKQPEVGHAHQIRLCGWKGEYANRFARITYPPSSNGAPVCSRHVGKFNYKKVPPEECDAAYLQDFIEGWQLFDGTAAPGIFERIVDTVDESAAEWLVKHAAVAGWFVTGFNTRLAYGGFTDKPMFPVRVTLSKDPKMAWTVEGVRPTKRVEPVYCATVPDVGCFSLSPGIYTKNCHFEQEWSAHFYGPEVVRASRWDCTLTQAYILDERRDGLSLEFLCQQHFGINIKQITGTLNKNNMKSEPLAKLLPYNGIDSKYHLHLFDAQAAELQRQKLTAPYEEKLRQVPTCVMTMLKGMPVDGEINKQFTVKYDQLLKEAETAIMALPEIAEFRQCKGVEFKPGSDKDILFLLREILHKEVPNTDKTVMEALDHPFGKMELAWRNASKMRSTYIEPFSVGRAYPDGLMHPYFGTCFTDTGRLMASDPNAQNLPKRDEDNREVRRQIAPPNGGIFLAADYGQIEARLIAAGSQDPVYCKATWDGYDVHGYWAGRIAKRCPDVLLPWSNLPEKEQMAKLRDKVKNRFVFPSFFSAQLGSVCHYMGIDENTLKPEYDQFWRDFAGIKSFQDKTLSDFQQQGYVACFNGRRRRAPLGLGQVINAAIQGSAADVVMDGMNRLSEMGRPEIQPMIMIHDDLTFWFHSERELEDNVDVIVHEMLNVRFDWLCVPLTVELSIGTNLCDMQKIGTVASDKLLGWPERPVFAQ